MLVTRVGTPLCQVLLVVAAAKRRGVSSQSSSQTLAKLANESALQTTPEARWSRLPATVCSVFHRPGCSMECVPFLLPLPLACVGTRRCSLKCL